VYPRLALLKKGAEVTVSAVKLLETAHFMAEVAPNLDVTSDPAVTVTFFQSFRMQAGHRSARGGATFPDILFCAILAATTKLLPLPDF